MAETVNYVDTRASDAALGTMSQTREPLVSDVDFSNHEDVGAAVEGYFLNQNLLGMAYEKAKERAQSVTATRDPNFNSYGYAAANAAKLGDVAYWIRNGSFASTQSPEEFDARADAIRGEMQRTKDMANGGWAGHALGTGVSFLDLSALVPFVGVEAKVGMAARAAIMAANSVALTTAQEAAAHGLQYTRSNADSLMNIGLSAPIGAGLGLFAGVLARGHVLHPEAPENPLRVENIVPEGTSTSPIGLRSLSAAATPTTVDFADKEGLGLVDWISTKMGTPASVARSLTDGEARRIMQDTAHLSGVTKANEVGVPTEASAEELLNTKYEAAYISLADKLNKSYVDANGALGQGAFATGIKREGEALGLTQNPLSEKEWNDALYRKLNDASFVHPNTTVDGYLGQATSDVRQFLDRFHQEGVKVGAFEEGQKVDNYVEQRWLSHKIAENPDAFSSVLLRQYERQTKRGPGDEWLQENYGLDRKAFEALPDTPVAPKPGEPAVHAKSGILSDWHYEADAIKLRRAEADAEAAATNLERSQYEYRVAAKLNRKAETDVRKVELKEAAANAKAIEAELGVEREKLTLARDNERSFIEAATAAREKTLQRETSFLDELNTKGEPKSRSADVAAQAARAQELGIIRQKQEGKVSALEERYARIQERVADLTDKANALRAKRADAIALRKELDLKARSARVESRRATARLNANTERLSYPDFVEETRRVLMDRTKTPYGFLEDAVGQSGRVKTRAIKLDNEAREELVSLGMLETDVNRLLQSYSRSFGGRLALREKFGNEDLAPELAKVSDNYAAHIAAAQAAGDGKKAKALADERELALAQIRLLRDRVLGRGDMSEDPASALMYVSRMARNINFLRYMGGSMLSSITDLATTSLSHGVGRHLATGLGQKVAKFAEEMSDREVRSVIFAGENGLLFSRAAKNMDIAELLQHRGMGQGQLRAVTGALEGSLRWGSEKMSVLNGMAWWNSRNKFLAGQVQMQNIIEDAKALTAGKELAPHRVTEYARFGMDLADLKGVAALVEKHGNINDHGLVDPNGAAWLSEPNGERLHNRLLVLLKRAVDEAIVTPTMADTPTFMSKGMGKVLFQFQTFGFAAVNKYARNLRYKAVNGQSWDALMSVTWALSLGAAVYALKEGVIKGQPLSDKPGQWAYEAVDRSGLAMFMMPWLAASMKLASPDLKSAGFNALDMPSRYREASWLSTFLGPTADLFDTVQGLGTDAARADWEKVGTKAKRLAPFQNLFYLDMLWRAANGEHTLTK